VKFPVFPSIKNKRDMIYIGNLAAFIKYVIDKNICGILYPTDPQKICTADMVKFIAKAHNHKIRFWSVFNPFVKLFMTKRNILALVFGDNYCTINTEIDWEAPYNLCDAICEIYK